MKTSDPHQPSHTGNARSEQPFLGAKAEQTFFGKERSPTKPFFNPSNTPSAPIQAKLTVGAVGDRYEQEADEVASEVVNRINNPTVQQGGDRPSIQRMQKEEEGEIERSPDSIQRKEDEEELQRSTIAETIQRVGQDEEDLQMKGAIGDTAKGGNVSSEFESTIQQARGGGETIAENVRTPFEQAFGADFSSVRVHADATSDQLNQSIQAKAFTTGQDVFFRQGAYEPESRGGQELIAHELTHVVQQNLALAPRSNPLQPEVFSPSELTVAQKRTVAQAPLSVQELSVSQDAEQDSVIQRGPDDLTDSEDENEDPENEDAEDEDIAANDVIIEEVEDEEEPVIKNPDAITLDLSNPTGAYPAILPVVSKQRQRRARKANRKRVRDEAVETPEVIVVDPKGDAYDLQKKLLELVKKDEKWLNRFTKLLGKSNLLSGLSLLEEYEIGLADSLTLMKLEARRAIPIDIPFLSEVMKENKAKGGDLDQLTTLMRLRQDKNGKLNTTGLPEVIRLVDNLGTLKTLFTLIPAHIPLSDVIKILKIKNERDILVPILDKLFTLSRIPLSDISEILKIENDPKVLIPICDKIDYKAGILPLLGRVRNGALLNELLGFVGRYGLLNAALDYIRDPANLKVILQRTGEAFGPLLEVLKMRPDEVALTEIYQHIDNTAQVPKLLAQLADHTLLSRLLQLPQINGKAHEIEQLLQSINLPADLETLIPAVQHTPLLWGLLQLTNQDGTILIRLVNQTDDIPTLKTLIPQVPDHAQLETLLERVQKKSKDLLALIDKEKDPALLLKFLELENNAPILLEIFKKLKKRDNLVELLERVKDRQLLIGLLDYEKDSEKISELIQKAGENTLLIDLFKSIKSTQGINSLIDQMLPADSLDLLPKLIKEIDKVGNLENLLKNVPRGRRDTISVMFSFTTNSDHLIRVCKQVENIEDVPLLLENFNHKNLFTLVGYETDGKLLLNLKQKQNYSEKDLLELLSKGVSGRDLNELLTLEPDTKVILPIIKEVKNTKQIKQLLGLVSDRPLLQDLRKEEKDPQILIEFLGIVKKPAVLKSLFDKDKDHNRLKELLVLVPEEDGEFLLRLLSPLGTAHAVFTPVDLFRLVKAMKSDGVANLDLLKLLTALSNEGKPASDILKMLEQMRGNFYVAKGATDNDPRKRPITDVPLSSAAEILAGTAPQPPGKKVLHGSEIVNHFIGTTSPAAGRAASTIETTYPTGHDIATRTDNELWFDCTLTTNLNDITTNAPELPAQKRIRQKMALQALMKRHATPRVQLVFAHDEGQSPRVIFSPEVEDALGAPAAHIDDRHVLGTGGTIDTTADVDNRAKGVAGYPAAPSVAGAFTSRASAQAAMGGALTQYLNGAHPANWQQMRREIITGAGINVPNRIDFPCNGYVADNTGAVFRTSNTPTGVHLVINGADVTGGFYVQSAWPLW